MVKRSKRLISAIDSLKQEIEKHFEKLEKDMKENNDILARYHIKEIDKSLITTLERKIILLGENKEDIILIKRFRDRLNDFKLKMNMID